MVSEPAQDEWPENRMQEVFLPVHGYIRLFPEEVAVISHPAFQRLRRVRQLGFAHYLFPGAVHTRFEHSIGTLHVAQRILNNVDLNHKRAQVVSEGGSYVTRTLEPSERILIRLGALCHDLGHLPFGHTLEDELEHLDKHDNSERLDRLANEVYPQFHIDPSLRLSASRPVEGWTLSSLINQLYKRFTDPVLPDVQPFHILKTLISKNETKQTNIQNAIPINVCKDIIGNTICADFLDYLFRDWYHLGKPLVEDKRLYQYMEVRVPKGDSEQKSKYEFVINAGYGNKRRHDALTSILDLLDSRYKLAETVLFHRTKLSITALLDRCLLEVRSLYRAVGETGSLKDWENYFKSQAIGLLLNGSDDDVPRILRLLANGGPELAMQECFANLAQEQEQAAKSAGHANQQISKVRPLFGESSVEVEQVDIGIDIKEHGKLIESLIERLEQRTVYTMATKLRIDELEGPPNLNNQEVKKIVSLFVKPESRSGKLLNRENRM